MIRFRAVLTASAAALVAGCATVDTDESALLYGQAATPVPEKSVKTYPAHAAYVGVTATNVIKWSEIASELQSVQFTLSPSDLLDKAVTTTSSTSNAYRDALIATVAATLAGQSVTKSRDTSVDATGAVTRTSSDQRSTTTPSIPDAAGTIQTSLVKDDSLGGSGVEAQANIELAGALAETMAIVNKRVTGLAVARGYRPYFVALQVALIPARHGYPYDTTVRLSFSLDTDDASAAAREQSCLVDDDNMVAPASAASDSPVVVLPLLVMDSVESTREVDLVEIARQLGSNIGGSTGIFGGSAQLERTLEKINQSEALRLNSLFSVTKAGPSCIRLRLGANRFGNAFEMVPRNRMLSLVVLVPEKIVDAQAMRAKESPRIVVHSTASFRDAAFFVKGHPYPDPADVTAPIESFPLPPVQRPACPPPDQDALITTTDATSVVSLSGGEGIELGRIAATLTTPIKPSGSRDAIKLAALDVRSTGNTLQFVFPQHTDGMPNVTEKQIALGWLRFSVAPTYEPATALAAGFDSSQPLVCPAAGATSKGYRVAYLLTPPPKNAPQQAPAVVTAPPPPVAITTAAPSTPAPGTGTNPASTSQPPTKPQPLPETPAIKTNDRVILPF